MKKKPINASEKKDAPLQKNRPGKTESGSWIGRNWVIRLISGVS